MKKILKQTKTILGKDIYWENSGDISLEYYIVESNEDNYVNAKEYGVEIIKRQNMLDGSILMENKFINNISTYKNFTTQMINLLAENIVTPVSMLEVIENLI